MAVETAKHATGPWTYHIGLDYTEFYDANGDTIFQVSYAMDEATACLIASAPELLKACESALARLDVYRTGPKHDAVMGELRTAIADTEA